MPLAARNQNSRNPSAPRLFLTAENKSTLRGGEIDHQRGAGREVDDLVGGGGGIAFPPVPPPAHQTPPPPPRAVAPRRDRQGAAPARPTRRRAHVRRELRQPPGRAVAAGQLALRG